MSRDKLPLIGRERALVEGLSKALQALVGGPPPSRKTLAAVRRHNSTPVYETARGNRFEVHIFDPDGEPTGMVAVVTVELDRKDESLRRATRVAT